MTVGHESHKLRLTIVTVYLTLFLKAVNRSTSSSQLCCPLVPVGARVRGLAGNALTAVQGTGYMRCMYGAEGRLGGREGRKGKGAKGGN